MFFTFSQNNSGGDFIVDENVAHYVIIEAKSSDQAEDKARSIGIYFDGCREGIDCPCCGDRWYNSVFEKGYPTPQIYGKAPLMENWEIAETPWNKCYIYYLDGRKEMALKPSFD